MVAALDGIEYIVQCTRLRSWRYAWNSYQFVFIRPEISDTLVKHHFEKRL